LLVGGVGATVLAVTARFFVLNVLLIESHLQTKAILAFYLAAATVAVLMTQQVFTAVLQAIGRFDWFSHITTFFSTILSFGNLILVLAGGDAVILLWWNLGLTIGGAAAFYLATKKLLPEAKFGWRFRQETLWRVTGFSSGIVAYQMLGSLWLLFERSYLTRVLGTESLTFYAVPMTLAIYLQVFVNSLVLVLLPLVSEIGANQNQTRLLAIYERATKYVGLIVVFACIALIIGSRRFLGLWLGDEFAVRSNDVLIFHVLTFGSMAFGAVVWQINEGLGFTTRNALLVLVWTVSGVGLLLWLTPLYGLAGAAAARTAGVLITLPVIILLVELKTFGKILWKFWRKTLFGLIVAGSAGGAAQYFLLQSLPFSWIGLLLATFVGGISFLVCLFLTGFFSIEEGRWLRQFAVRALATN
jgi:O-antigen/teichoic acid export membrane protein